LKKEPSFFVSGPSRRHRRRQAEPEHPVAAPEDGGNIVRPESHRHCHRVDEESLGSEPHRQQEDLEPGWSYFLSSAGSKTLIFDKFLVLRTSFFRGSWEFGVQSFIVIKCEPL
jgi:hypothetical protein